MKKMMILIILTFFKILPAQNEITEYPAMSNIFLIGDRVFSLYYITSEGVIVVDPINEKIANETLKSIRKKTDLPIKFVIYSHNHWDHNMGGKVFKDQGATFIAHRKAYENMAFNPDVIKPDILWDGEEKILKSGGQNIELLYFGKNHGDGMTIFRFPEHNTLFTVDLVVPDRVLYAYLPDAKPKAWLKDLYQIKNLSFDQLLMAHVRPIGTRKDLDLQISYFEDLYQATENAIKSGINTFDIPKSVSLPKYKHLQNYEEWLHMNVWRIMMEKLIGQ